jgi:hypothetical protein
MKGYVAVREGTGGVLRDGTTNHPALDFDAPPVLTAATVGDPDPKDDDGELPDIKNDPVPEDDAAVDHEPPVDPGG